MVKYLVLINKTYIYPVYSGEQELVSLGVPIYVCVDCNLRVCPYTIEIGSGCGQNGK